MAQVGEDAPQCRVCWGQADEPGPQGLADLLLERPCGCRGHLGHVHLRQVPLGGFVWSPQGRLPCALQRPSDHGIPLAKRDGKLEQAARGQFVHACALPQVATLCC